MRTHRHDHVPRLRHVLGVVTTAAAAVAVALVLAGPAGGMEPFADASYRDSQVVVAEAATEPFADASYRDSQVVVAEAATEPVADASYREANRVVVPTAAAGGYDWVDGIIGGAVVLGIIAAIGAGIAIWWTTTHHGPRHPRGPAVPMH